MTRNQDLHVLHVDDAAAWVNGLDWRAITGDTLLFDYVYFLHPVCHTPRIYTCQRHGTSLPSSIHLSPLAVFKNMTHSYKHRSRPTFLSTCHAC